MTPLVVQEHFFYSIHAMLSADNPGMKEEDLRAVFAGQQSGKNPSLLEAYTRAETAKILKVSLSTVDRWLAQKIICGSYVCGTVRISSSEIQRLLLPKEA